MRFLVVGLGNFGASVAEGLQRLGHEVVALDRDLDKVEGMAAVLSHAVLGDATDPEVLERVGAAEATVGIVSTGDDVSAAVLIAISLRDLGMEHIYVKVVSDLQASILDKIGVTNTVFPERESAQLLARRISRASLLSYFELGPDFSAQEMVVPEDWVGRSLRELELPRRHNVSVVAVRDYLSDHMEPIPDPDAPLKESDTLLLAGRAEDLDKVARIR